MQISTSSYHWLICCFFLSCVWPVAQRHEVTVKNKTTTNSPTPPHSNRLTCREIATMYVLPFLVAKKKKIPETTLYIKCSLYCTWDSSCRFVCTHVSKSCFNICICVCLCVTEREWDKLMKNHAMSSCWWLLTDKAGGLSSLPTTVYSVTVDSLQLIKLRETHNIFLFHIHAATTTLRSWHQN